MEPRAHNKVSDKHIIPMAKILICSADSTVALRWSQSVDGLGRQSTASSREAIITSLDAGHTDIALLDLQLYDGNYRQVVDLFCKPYPDTAFIFFSQQPNEEEGLYLISQGGRGYCNRYISEALLAKAVEVVRMGEVWLGRKLLFKLMENVSRLTHTASEQQATEHSKLSQLTEREKEIAILVGEGASNKVIARQLDITERTVKAHISSIFRKTDTKDRLQLGLLINITSH